MAYRGGWKSTNNTALDDLSFTDVTGGERPCALVARLRYEDLGTLNQSLHDFSGHLSWSTVVTQYGPLYRVGESGRHHLR